ncbi:unnamed protein product, partial [Ascophyllum nodosum]
SKTLLLSPSRRLPPLPSRQEKERFTLCLAVMADGQKVPLRIIFKGTLFIPPRTPGKGKATQPRKNSIAAEILPANRSKNGIIKQRPCILVLDDFKCHKGEGFVADLKRKADTIVIFIPGGLTPLLQPLDRMLNKQMKRLLRGMYTSYSASVKGDPRTGKLKPPGRGVVAKWCKDALASITPETVKTCFKICGLTLALDGSEDHA